MSAAAMRQSTSACPCGTPKLVVIRVVQPPPGPMPTLIAVDAALEQEPRAFCGRDVAGDQLDVAEPLAHLGDRAIHDAASGRARCR